jgi:hypothetical protein
MIARYRLFTFSPISYPLIVLSCFQASRGHLAYSAQVI